MKQKEEYQTKTVKTWCFKSASYQRLLTKTLQLYLSALDLIRHQIPSFSLLSHQLDQWVIRIQSASAIVRKYLRIHLKSLYTLVFELIVRIYCAPIWKVWGNFQQCVKMTSIFLPTQSWTYLFLLFFSQRHLN